MGCQAEMVEMDFQGEKERGETMVCRDHLVHKVGKFSMCITTSPSYILALNSYCSVTKFGNIDICSLFSSEYKFIVLTRDFLE